MQFMILGKEFWQNIQCNILNSSVGICVVQCSTHGNLADINSAQEARYTTHGNLSYFNNPQEKIILTSPRNEKIDYEKN